MSETMFVGEIHPYLLRYDGWIAAIFVCCFFSMFYVFAQGKHVLIQRMYSISQIRERENVFAEKTAVDLHCQLLLLLQTCILASILFYETTFESKNEDALHMLLPLYAVATILFCTIKWLAYQFVNWIFFEPVQNKLWIESYFFTISVFGILLFPISLSVVYLGLSPFWSGIFFLFLFLLVIFLKLYKSFFIFFRGLHGALFLFLYFCTLEILPLLVLGKGIGMINSLQI